MTVGPDAADDRLAGRGRDGPAAEIDRAVPAGPEVHVARLRERRVGARERDARAAEALLAQEIARDVELAEDDVDGPQGRERAAAEIDGGRAHVAAHQHAPARAHRGGANDGGAALHSGLRSTRSFAIRRACSTSSANVTCSWCSSSLAFANTPRGSGSGPATITNLFWARSRSSV